MLKHKSKLIIFIIAILTLITFSYSYAVDNDLLISEKNDVEIEENSSQMNNESNSLDQNQKDVNSDLYLFEENVVIDYVVEGNVYIISNSVTIKSQINGDVFVISKVLNIENSSNVINVYALANSINIDGFVSTIYTCADNLTLNSGSYVYRDVYAMLNTFNVFGMVARNVNATFDNISFTSENNDEINNGKIAGDLNYISSNTAKIDDDSVLGKINYTQKVTSSNTLTLFDYLSSLATCVATVFAIYFILSWLAPKFKEISKELLQKKAFPVLGFGAIGLFAIPLATILLLLIGIGSTLALALISLYVLLLCIATSIFIIALSEVLIEKLKFEDKIKKLGILSALTIGYWLIKLIPFLGGLVSFVAVLLGFGLIIKTILKK